MPEVIGVYPDPPPAECSVINSVRVANIGAIPLARSMTKLRDKIYQAAEQLLAGLDGG